MTPFNDHIWIRKYQTFVFGLRPVANITCEKPSTVSLFVFNESEPSADFTIAWGDSSVWKLIPLKDICSATKSLICEKQNQVSEEETLKKNKKKEDSWTKYYFKELHTSSSNPLRTFFCRINTWTSLIKPLKIPANSKAMYPPPTIAIFLGAEGKSRAASEFIAYSFPGISGKDGLPPTAISMCLAVYSLPSTSTVWGPSTCKV